MKKIVNLTQTYRGLPEWSPLSDGKDRAFLIEYLIKNKDQIKIRQLLDHRTYSFHNVEEKKYHTLCDIIKTALPDTEFFRYDKVTFAFSILSQLKYFKKIGMTDVLWVQDDEFFTYPNLNDFINVYEYYKTHEEIKHINLKYDTNEFNLDYSKYDRINIGNVNIFKTTTRDLAVDGHFGMDNSAFICNIDMLLEKMYDDSFARVLNAYDLEKNLCYKSIRNNVDRYICNVRFFETFNIVGMIGSLGRAEQAMTRLKKLFD